MPKKSNEISHDTKIIITVLTLLFVFPVGLILMLYWKMFPVWVRVMITILFCLILIAFFIIFIIAMSVVINPLKFGMVQL